MICRDWRDATAAEIAPLYGAERERWRRDLAWDPVDVLAVVEQGRQGGHVAGWLARDAHQRVMGWTFYVLHDSMLQIGGLVAERPSVARQLLDAVMDSPEASVARGLSCFIFPDASGIASALSRQRFALRESVYMWRSIEAAGKSGADVLSLRPWTHDDFAGTVRLLAGAYEGVPGSECFAQNGRREQWAHYTWQLLRTPGCGRFDPALSRVFCAPGSATPSGVVLVSWIAPDTVHIGQVAVAGDQRGRGLASALIDSALHAAVENGAREVTLMVDAANSTALSLYSRLGFTERARMLYGSRAARNRVAA